MAWFILIVAGLLEAVWVYAMKQSEGFSHIGYSAVALIAFVASFACHLQLKGNPIPSKFEE